MWKLSRALLIVALVCALILALIYKKTAPIIEQQKQMLLERSLQSVLAADSYNKQEKEIVYYEAVNNEGKILGWCLPLEAKGYGGPIQILVGVDISEKITGVRVLDDKETPGLGSKIRETEYKQAEAEFLKQFKQKNVKDVLLVKRKTLDNIQAVTGATISSKAVTDCVRINVEKFLKNK
ncbi:MAG: RnfABCDGE type electron transport complex subunit G [Candidatus Omnitrophota bacterium]